ncbi:MAG TPA: hypothetical protein VK934_11210 [Fimbriimonas sp.]|nr:hypothetical protein [Fimbriimonas sp.]
MKRVQLFAVVLMALALLIGCAGSSDDGTPTTNGVLTGTPRIEAVVKIDRTNLINPSQYTDAELRDPTKVNPNDLINPTLYGVQDPRNIQTGEQYWFQLVRYNELGQREIISDGVTWQLSDPRYAELGENSGLFLAGNNATQTNQFAFAFYGGTRYEARYEVNPRQVRLIGIVLQEGTNQPIPGVELFFFDNFGTLVGQTASSYDGTFRASVPTNTVSFSPTVESIPTTFFQSFVFDMLRYSVGYPQCKAPLPALEVGTMVLQEPIYLTPRVAGQPTPDPTGCEI